MKQQEAYGEKQGKTSAEISDSKKLHLRAHTHATKTKHLGTFVIVHSEEHFYRSKVMGRKSNGERRKND